MIHEHVLDGCRPTPLAHSLKALGLMRIPQTQGNAIANSGRVQQFLRSTVTCTAQENVGTRRTPERSMSLQMACVSNSIEEWFAGRPSDAC
jgi:hypothetical protein